MAKVFLDTNLLLYTVDKQDPDKHEQARRVLKRITCDHVAVISTQVLQEFYSAATSKLKLDKMVAKHLLHSFANLETVVADLALIEQAVDISALFQLSFWDSLVVAAAERGNCSYLVTEDLNDGQSIRGVQVVNPFKNPDFAFADRR